MTQVIETPVELTIISNEISGKPLTASDIEGIGFAIDATNKKVYSKDSTGALFQLGDVLQSDLDDFIATHNLDRPDIYLANQNIANMSYNANGDLDKIQYITATDTNYQILTYDSNVNLISIDSYINSVLAGTTLFTYDTNQNLVSVVFTPAP